MHTVLQGFDLQVPAGHIASLLGPSGCGKTSVLRAIAGFEPVRAGSIHLGEVLLSGPGTHLPPEQRHVGMMFQEYGLFPHLTALQNVGFGLRRMGKPERDKRVHVCRSCLPWWGWRIQVASSRTSCPAVSSSVWRWPAPWRRPRPCCCSMSHFPISMPPRASA